MIICIRIKNFFSIKDDVVLDFTADMSSRGASGHLTDNLIDFNGDSLVNIIGMFGSNAAGKSNIIKAVDFCRRLVLRSHLNNDATEFDFSPFKFDVERPSEFYIDFVAGGVEYEYSFSILSGRIVSESLYYYPRKRKARVFSRENGDSYSFGKGLLQRPGEVAAGTGSKTLFLSRAASLNRQIACGVYDFFHGGLLTEHPGFDLSAMTREEFESHKEMLLRALEVSDSDIVDMRWSQDAAGAARLLTFHRENPEIPFDFEREESEGTKRLLFILLALLKCSARGSAVFLDEFDLKLHLRLAEFILDVVRATRRMQLVFTSHNPMLIDSDRLRGEQIVFVNKNADGGSEATPLSDFVGIGRKTDIRKAYLQGRFDAVPYVGDVDSVVAECWEE